MLLATFMKTLVLTSKGLGYLGLLVHLKSSFCFKFCMHSSLCLFLLTWHTPSWFLTCMLLTKVSRSKASCCDVSKCKLLICQFVHGLCKIIQDNLIMTKKFGDEMILKTTLLVWKPMVKSNGLVSCVTNLHESL